MNRKKAKAFESKKYEIIPWKVFFQDTVLRVCSRVILSLILSKLTLHTFYSQTYLYTLIGIELIVIMALNFNNDDWINIENIAKIAKKKKSRCAFESWKRVCLINISFTPLYVIYIHLSLFIIILICLYVTNTYSR